METDPPKGQQNPKKDEERPAHAHVPGRQVGDGPQAGTRPQKVQSLKLVHEVAVGQHGRLQPGRENGKDL